MPRLTLEQLEQRIDDFEAIVGNHAREVAALAAEVRRLAETLERQVPTRIEIERLPDLPVPKLSWSQELARRQVPMSRAVGWSTVALALVEVLHAIVEGHIRFW